MLYKWRSDDIKYAVDAGKVGRLFEKIEKREGSVTNKAVLDAARPESSPIHSCFEWDDTKAAEKYRLTQASCMICNLMVEVEEPDMEGPQTVRAFVNVSEKKEGSFNNIVAVLQDDEGRAKVLADALSELASFQKKYKNLSELAEVFRAIAMVSSAT